jgi:hypothetical protein
MEDTVFRQRLACRWQDLRMGPLHLDSIFHDIDSMALLVDESQQRNFKQWPILGVYVWPNPGVLPTTYSGEINKLKTWTQQRIAWLDNAFNSFLPVFQPEWEVAAAGIDTWILRVVNPDPSLVYTWELGDGTVLSGAEVLYSYGVSGSYSIRLITATPFGCSEATEKVIDIVVATSAVNLDEMLRVFPNPAGDRCWITLPEGHSWEGMELKLYNSLGQGRSLKNTFDGRLSLEGIPSGVYQLQVRKAQQRWQQKLVLQK